MGYQRRVLFFFFFFFYRKMLLLDLHFFVLAPKRLGSFIRVHRVLTPKKTGPFIRTHRVLTRKIPGPLIRAHINVSFYRTPLKKTYTKVKERINPVDRVTSTQPNSCSTKSYLCTQSTEKIL